MFHYTVETDKSIEEAVRALESKLQEASFGVQWQFNIQETLQKKGYELDYPFIVLEVCNPKDAQRVLKRNQLIGYFLPCKIVVYENQEGKTHIGMPKPTVLIQMVEDGELKEIAAEIERELIDCIDKSK